MLVFKAVRYAECRVFSLFGVKAKCRCVSLLREKRHTCLEAPGNCCPPRSPQSPRSGFPEAALASFLPSYNFSQWFVFCAFLVTKLAWHAICRMFRILEDFHNVSNVLFFFYQTAYCDNFLNTVLLLLMHFEICLFPFNYCIKS